MPGGAGQLRNSSAGRTARHGTCAREPGGSASPQEEVSTLTERRGPIHPTSTTQGRTVMKKLIASVCAVVFLAGIGITQSSAQPSSKFAAFASTVSLVTPTQSKGWTTI